MDANSGGRREGLPLFPDSWDSVLCSFPSDETLEFDDGQVVDMPFGIWNSSS